MWTVIVRMRCKVWQGYYTETTKLYPTRYCRVWNEDIYKDLYIKFVDDVIGEFTIAYENPLLKYADAEVVLQVLTAPKVIFETSPSSQSCLVFLNYEIHNVKSYTHWNTDPDLFTFFFFFKLIYTSI